MTYTLANKATTESGTLITPIQGLPLMTILQARAACEIARDNGHDVIVYNVSAQ